MSVIKNTSSDGIALVPSAYLIEECVVSNKDGECVDVQYLLQSIQITESLHSPTLICKITALDEVNLIEVLPFFGLETIRLKISRRQGETGSAQSFDHVFYVTDYPLFNRPRREHTQVWSITGVSFHAWKNPLIKISRAYHGVITDQIKKIALDSFGVSLVQFGSSETRGQGIIPIFTPLKAIDWFRRRVSDEKSCPFYLYETLQNPPSTLNFASHSELSKQDAYFHYYDTRSFQFEAATQDDYDERRARMLDCTSLLKLSKFNPIAAGAFASETNYIDIAKRKFGKRFYDYSENFPISATILKTNIFETPKHADHEPEAGQHASSGKPVPVKNMELPTEEFYSHQNYLARNSEAYGDEENYIEMSWEKMNVLEAFPGIFNTLMHEVELHGDLELNAGKIVHLHFPKAVDPISGGFGNLEDEYLTGKYMVTSAIHTFKDQEYYTHIRVKRDSFVQ